MVNAKAGKPYALKAVLEYITNPAKTQNGELVSAKDCLTESAYQQMVLTKNTFQQTTGRQYVHMIQSFSVDDKLTGEIAHDIGRRLTERFCGFQAVIATHTDRGHIHNHIVLNSVNWENGHKWQFSAEDLKNLKAFSDELCREYGLTVIEKKRGWKSYGENEAFNSGRGWKAAISKTVAACVKYSTNRMELIHNLHSAGIEVEFGKRQLLFKLPKWGVSCGSDKLLAYGDFTRENIAQYLKFNALQYENSWHDDRILGEACRTIGAILRHTDPDSLRRDVWDGKPLSAFEGQALKDAIIRLKNSSGFTWQTSNSQEEKSDSGMFLMTISELLLLAITEKEEHEIENARRAAAQYEYEYDCDDEVEYEL